MVKSLQPVQCPICGKVYSGRSNLRTHIQNVHEDIPEDQWLDCEICGKKWKTRQKLVDHMNKTHGIYQYKNSAQF